MATTADGRSAAIKRRIAATTRRPSALGYSARCGCVESSGAARESGPSVCALAAEELAHSILELPHAGGELSRLSVRLVGVCVGDSVSGLRVWQWKVQYGCGSVAHN